MGNPHDGNVSCPANGALDSRLSPPAGLDGATEEEACCAQPAYRIGRRRCDPDSRRLDGFAAVDGKMTVAS